jgi:hypothetical protein
MTVFSIERLTLRDFDNELEVIRALFPLRDNPAITS